MLSAEQNERLTKVGPGTPGGELLRRYWHPIAATVQMKDRWAMPVRLLGEDLVLYRDLKGDYGLIGQVCAHRNMDLSYGVPEENGLRCAYHGWLYDATGQCIEQPAEPEGSSFKEKIRIAGYPVQELRGLIFAYLGPAPAPVLPRWDLFVWDNVERSIESTVLPCNWLQAQENSLDGTHLEWLHGYYFKRLLQADGKPWEWIDERIGRHHAKIGFDRFEYGIIKRRVYAGETEEAEGWRIGHPILFPNILRQGTGRRHHFQIRTPVDDDHMLHFWYYVDVPEPGLTVEEPEYIPWKEKPLYGPDGRLLRDTINNQDYMVWVGQGRISDRSRESLGVGDIGVIMFRRLLEEQVRVVEDGGDPINVHREHKDIIVLPQESSYYPGETVTGGPFKDAQPAPAESEATLVGQ